MITVKRSLAFLVGFSLFVCLLFIALASFAATPTSDTAVGDTVTDPATGADVTVTGLMTGSDGKAYAVTTDNDRLIYTTTTVDDIFPDSSGDWTVETVTPTSGDVTEFTMSREVTDPDSTDDPPATINETKTLVVSVEDRGTIVDENGDPIDPSGTPGDPETDIDPPPAATGDNNTVYSVRKGSSGDDGRDGYGVEVCDPTGLLGCVTIAYDPKPGKNGSTPSALDRNLPSSHGDIETVSSKRAGITAIRTGGDGGTGGDAYGNIDAENGGAAGAGGNVTVTANVTISTSGYKGHGIFAKSNAGKAGDGGSGILWSDGGFSGASANGGTVRVTTETASLISTTGNYAYGILAQSLGGAAGSGGDSWGIVGDGGSSGTAGHGGSVYVTHWGDIITDGDGSHTIFAQSIGGQGGDGGGAAGIVGLGGDGSVGGNGGSVSVTTTTGSNIETKDEASHGILAQSIGGGGGNGGVGVGIVGLGGAGSGGGNGASVSVSHDGLILTRGEGSSGILAQSVGGGGGNAGVSAGIVALGSNGSGGGNGGSVTVNTGSAGSITTIEKYSHAILAQSIGGGGGTGGTGGGVVAIGGSGGGGGNGSSVSVDSAAAIETQGDYSRAIYAQSIGGGGGDGGAGGGVVSIGGTGSGGGNGGTVGVSNSGQVESWGFAADAIFAQSIGGGGGSGGGSGGLVSLGGGGNGGGYGSTVIVNNSGSITTHRGFADAIFAQSIGGGGGSGAGSGGGVSIGGDGSVGGNGGEVSVINSGTILTLGVGEKDIATWWNEAGTDLTVLGIGAQGIFAQSVGGGGGSGAGSGGLVSLGGDGAGGGDGNKVTVDSSGSITTDGDFAEAIFAQSIGGGGGSGAGSGGAVSIGGSGDGGGNGGQVSVTNSGQIITRGIGSEGVFAQSVGGGGGSGAGSGGLIALGGSASGASDGGAVTVTNSGIINTADTLSSAIFSQSVGGGGGSGGTVGGTFFTMGGDGSSGGNAGTVNVASSNDLITSGDDSDGVFAQSLGGGGGNAGSAVSGSAFAGVAIGSGGGGGGDGDSVSVTIQTHTVAGEDVASLISTAGNRSRGIFAQSVGGGGGNGGSAVQGTLGTFGAVSVAVGGSGGAGGDGQDVTVNAAAQISTQGEDSDGLIAQSIGGGGGNGGYVVAGTIQANPIGGGAVAVGVGGSGGDGGSAAAVIANLAGSILTHGDQSGGLLAQSIGGGGGTGGFNVTSAVSAGGVGSGAVAVGVGGSGGDGGDGATVSSTVGGNISTYGKDADALLVQSVGGGGGNGGFTIASTISGAGGGSGAISAGVGGSGGAGGHGAGVTLELIGNITTAENESGGVLAQSVGGGGGNGGFNISSAVSGAGAGSGAISVGVGGSGDIGGNGGIVNGSVTGNITTQGADADGAVFQSVGGGGGNGGFNISGAISGAGGGSGTIAVGVGGAGAGGGSSAAVVADVLGVVITQGDRSEGILAQSVGGGGGNGGFNITGAISGAGIGSGGVAVGVGAAGGTGGNASTVNATVAGYVGTSGNEAAGVVIQSVGGGGGNGGFSIDGAISGAGTGGGAVAVGVGGSGGSGGDAAAVTATVSGEKYTGGNNSTAVLAQSIGGGGGTGGFSINGTISGAGIGSGGVTVGVGGSGGGGGTSSTVDADINGNMLTEGDESGVVVIQSVGGGGGNGGFNVSNSISGAGTGSGAVSVGIGGSGGDGGVSGSVNAAVAGDIVTRGDGSDGVVAQSIGGGGGNGGLTISGGISGASTGSGAVAVGIGGTGGGGGNAEMVTASIIGAVGTYGEESSGVVIQSVGGGGGNGGLSVDRAISGSGTFGGAVAVGIGGSGGSGGDGAAVLATVSGEKYTADKNSNAVVVQSLGGGGGHGGLNVSGSISGAGTGSGAVTVGIGGSGGGGGTSSTVDADIDGDMLTIGKNSGAVVVQSVGGGGGSGGISIGDAISGAGTGSGAVSVGIGGSGGDGGNSGRVTAAMESNITTQGDNSDAVLVQSIGGGGGNGGVNVSGSISLSKVNGGSVGVGVGGFGGDGGDAGNVDAVMSGILMTLGVDSGGVLAQSIGGGGGNGGVNVTGTVNATGSGAGASVALGVGGFGGGGGDAGTVSLTRIGDSQTMNDGAVAITAQSIGGGGGNGGVNVSGSANLALHGGGAAVSAGLGGFGGSGGTGGDVSAMVQGHVYTGDVAAETGRDAVGVLVQSVGGSGGHGGTNITGSLSVALNGTSASVGLGVGGFGGGGGNSGSANLDLSGDVVTTGADAHAVMAQSIAGGGGNGGLNVSGAVAVTNTGQSYSAAIGVGGFGGDGGDAGDASTRVAGNVLASGLRNDEIIVVPDMVVDGEALPGTGYSYRVMEDGSHGVFTQSVGGGGGNGGINISGGISAANPTVGKTGSLVLGVGGFGAAGGDAGDVTSSVSGEWTTATGDGRAAILAQSLGGGGGNGGINVSGGIVIDGPMIVGVGGFGGAGGTGGDVTVEAETNLRAEGKDAVGLLAQSIGGGGGNGAINISGAIAVNKKGTLPSATFGVGGFGGAGAVSGDVAVNQNGTLTVNGESGHGLLAQSIAGGGGNGGLNIASSINHSSAQAVVKKSDLSIVVGLGGHAGDGADAGDVSVISTGDVITQGDFARGIFAQSIGGGGGTGGMNVSSVFADQGSPIIVGIGGFGGGGGHAGSVTVTRGDSENLAGRIETTGSGAIGIEASSIGGGGGDAGMNFLISIATGGSSGTTESIDSNPYKGKVDDRVITNYNAVITQLTGNNSGSAGTSNPYAVQLAIGGDGGVAGHGDTVSVIDYSDITTYGFQSYGILAQSIGGGGGNATFNLGLGYAPNAKAAKIALGGQPGDGGNGATVQVDHHGSIATDGKDAVGIIAQSIGGGGGNVGFDFVFNKTSAGSVALTIGRKGGSGGSGGDVELASNGTVLTRGDNAYGLLAQSVGNGGGNSSSYSAGFSSADSGSGETSGAVAIGIEGGVGGEAGTVTLNAAGRVSTQGEKAHAIFAQSVGGGGGNGGNANTGAITAPAVGVSLGGTGGVAGIGQRVIVDNLADVETQGDKAVGILAQSIGGGGGTGGAAYSGGLKTSGSGVQVTVGGSGGTGADGGEIVVDNAGRINTQAERAHAIVAQSIGGGGGDGGMVINGLRSTSDNSARVFVSVGGDGGTGGIGKSIDVNNTGVIKTLGKEAVGVLAQSIGGGGGSGSTVITGSFSSASGGATVGLGIGGTGGTGGISGDVTVGNFITEGVDDSGTISTEGDGAHGVFALSIGGGGGTGSTVITTTNSLQTGATAPSTALILSIGGDGGTGGAAGKVTAENNGLIVTRGDGAHGIVAESIGGGGGNGGLSVSGNLLIGSMASSGLNSAISVGGDGGNGNIGNDVLVDNSGMIETYGDTSYGIFAQSVGGGGGNGGVAVAASVDPTIVTGFATQSTVLSIGIGGSGGDGAMAGDVTVNHSGSITTNGADTYGIYAQSVGGGGGTSALSYSSPFWMAIDNFSMLLGAKDSSAGIAGDVTVNSTGTIVTAGANSSAIFTQAISSGGGDLKTFLDLSQDASSLDQEVVDIEEVTSATEDLIASFKGVVGLGGDGNQDNAGGAVYSSHVGDILATGDNSSGWVLQSIGGGGGSNLFELLARPQDVVELELTLGATGSTNVGGGAVAAERTGQVTTLGAQGKGVSIQSIGGGGGSLNQLLTRSPGDEPVVAATASVRIGADGGVDHHGYAIDLDMSGDLYTQGDRAQGILVQSIGAGGGELRLSGIDSVDLLLGGQAGASGNGGNISITNRGLVSTAGEHAHGVFLQSIGGGGGAVFTDLDETAVNLTFSDTGNGSGGDINFFQQGDIVTSGDRAYGAFIQSIGGGGGAIDTLFSGSSGGTGTGGNLNLTFSDDVISSGTGATGVFAQSAAGNGQLAGNIEILLDGEWVIGGTETGRGVDIVEGADNLLINNAILTTVDGLDGLAISGTTGSEIIHNYGTIIGNVDLGDGQNSFYNWSRDSLLSGSILAVGDGNTVTNAGSISPGGLDNLQETNLTGNFVQTVAGIYHVDLDFDGNNTDLIRGTGSAIVAGEVELNTMTPERLMPGKYTLAIVTADLGVSDLDAALLVRPSAVVEYQLVTPDTQSLAIWLNIDFSPTGLTRNQVAIGGYFNDVQLAGGSASMDPYIRYLFLLPDTDELAATYAPLIPDYYDNFTQTTVLLTQQFVKPLMLRMRNLHQAGQMPSSLSQRFLYENPVLLASNGTDSGLSQLFGQKKKPRDTYAMWLNVGGFWGEQGTTEDFSRYDYRSRSLVGGIDYMFGDKFTLGLSLGQAGLTLDVDDSQGQGDIDSTFVAVYASCFTDRYYLDGVLSFGRHNYDNVRNFTAFSDPVQTTSEHHGHSLSVYGESGYNFHLPDWFLQPFVALQYVYLDESAFETTGAGALNLVMKDRYTESLSFDLGGRLSRAFETPLGAIVPEISATWNYNFGLDDRILKASFAGFRDASFAIKGQEEVRHMLKMSAGLNFLGKSGFSSALKYTGEWQDGSRVHGVTGELRIAF